MLYSRNRGGCVCFSALIVESSKCVCGGGGGGGGLQIQYMKVVQCLTRRWERETMVAETHHSVCSVSLSVGRSVLPEVN